MSKARSIRSFITLSGLIILLVCLVPLTSVEEVVKASFKVGPGTAYGPPDLGTNYHTRIFGKSALRGEVTAEDGIYLTVYGYNAKDLVDLYIKGRYDFTIDPADDLYTFIFDNADGHGESFVDFKLKETWTRPVGISSPPVFVLGMAGFLLLLAGLVAQAHHSTRRTSNRFILDPKTALPSLLREAFSSHWTSGLLGVGGKIPLAATNSF